MTEPKPPPMLKYKIYFDGGDSILIVTSCEITVEDDMKWIKAYLYHPNVGKYGWNTMLQQVYFNIKKTVFIIFEGYVKSPLGKPPVFDDPKRRE